MIVALIPGQQHGADGYCRVHEGERHDAVRTRTEMNTRSSVKRRMGSSRTLPRLATPPPMATTSGATSVSRLLNAMAYDRPIRSISAVANAYAAACASPNIARLERDDFLPAHRQQFRFGGDVAQASAAVFRWTSPEQRFSSLFFRPAAALVQSGT